MGAEIKFRIIVCGWSREPNHKRGKRKVEMNLIGIQQLVTTLHNQTLKERKYGTCMNVF